MGDKFMVGHECTGDYEKFESKAICEAYGAKVEAGFTCTMEADCESECGEGNFFDANGNLIQTYTCKLKSETDNACTDVREYPADSGEFRSKEVCDAFAAAAEAESRTRSQKTCTPSINCVDPDSGHACQEKVTSEAGEYNRYFCEIKTFSDDDTIQYMDGLFNSLGAHEVTSCSDVKQDSNGVWEVR